MKVLFSLSTLLEFLLCLSSSFSSRHKFSKVGWLWVSGVVITAIAAATTRPAIIPNGKKR